MLFCNSVCHFSMAGLWGKRIKLSIAHLILLMKESSEWLQIYIDSNMMSMAIPEKL